MEQKEPEAMATKLLTDKTVNSAKAQPRERLELWDSHTKGLCLRVSSETRVWVVRYRANGRQRRFVIGDAAEMDLADARIAAATILRDAKRRGTDPAGERKRRKDEAKAQPIKTFGQLADAYLQACRNGEWKPRGKRQAPRTIKDAEESLNRYVRPDIGEMALADISRPTIKRLLRGMAARGIAAQTNKALAVIRQTYAYAIAEWEGKLVAVNPATGIPREQEIPSSRTLSDDELKLFWAALKDPSGLRLRTEGGEDKRVYLSRQMAILLQLSVLLLGRRAEHAGMMRSELNLEQATWIVAPDRMKNRLAHLVPLSPRALELIREAVTMAEARQADESGRRPNDFPIFPSPRDPSKPIRPGTVTHAMAPVIAALELPAASPHDLRRTGSSALTSERLGVSPFIRSRLLSHTTETGGGAAVSSKHYDVNTYAQEKRKALEAWEGLLLEIVGERARPTNVRQFHEARG
jgi:integrase